MATRLRDPACGGEKEGRSSGRWCLVRRSSGRTAAYGGKKLARWCEEQGGWENEVVELDKEVKGFGALPKRRIVERTFGWLVRNRRLGKHYERKVQTSETLIEVATIRLILGRLASAA